MDKQKAAKKFETTEGAKAVEGPTVAPIAPTEKPKAAPPVEKKKEKEEDFATRLMRAKKKAMEERDKDKDKPK